MLRVRNTREGIKKKNPINYRDIAELHKNLGISDKNFDTFKRHLESILLDM